MDTNTRSYEISLWELDDSFVDILATSKDSDNKLIINPSITKNINGTSTFSCQIPIMVYDGDYQKLVDNPVWWRLNKDGEIKSLTNNRKIKVIFNKDETIELIKEYKTLAVTVTLPCTDDSTLLEQDTIKKMNKLRKQINENIHEFVITKITEQRSNRQINCTIEASGLAFLELGKTGYNLSFSLEDLEVDYDKIVADAEQAWKDAHGDILDGFEVPAFATLDLNYWLDRVVINTKWNYDIQMDWSEYNSDRLFYKIYEPEHYEYYEYNNDDMAPKELKTMDVKERAISAKESNRYNITQTLAETFEVFARYDYIYNEDFHIIGRIITFFNDIISDDSDFEVNYAKNLSGLSRTMDSNNLVSKLYVKEIESEYSDSGLITIADTRSNPLLDKFILNFDYMYKIGAIDDAQMTYVESFKKQLASINKQIMDNRAKYNDVATQINEATALQQFHKLAYESANEDMGDMASKKDVYQDNMLRRDKMFAKSKVLEGGLLEYDFTEKGIMDTNFKLYIRTVSVVDNFVDVTNFYTIDYIYDIYRYTVTGVLISEKPGNNGKYDIGLDSNGDPALIVNGVAYSTYFSYNYNPYSYYNTLMLQYQQLAEMHQSATDFYSYRVNEVLENNRAELDKAYDVLADSKNTLEQEFETIMGIALREGSWNPDNYTIPYVTHINNEINNDSSKESYVGFHALLEGTDVDLDWGLMESFGYVSALDPNDITKYLPFVAWNMGISSSDPAPIEVEQNIITYRELFVGVDYNLHYTKVGETYIPVIMFTDPDIDKNSLYYYCENSNPTTVIDDLDKLQLFVRIVGDFTSDGPVIINKTRDVKKLDNTKLSNIDASNIYVRSIIIESPQVIQTSITIYKNDSIELEQYKDYVIYRRGLQYLILIKEDGPTIGGELPYKLYYQTSRAADQLYLDAIQVMEDNAMPVASYDVTMSYLVYKSTQDQYEAQSGAIVEKYPVLGIGSIVYINDNELSFYAVRGMISEYTINLIDESKNSYKIQNYKTRFEDLFSKITAATEQMRQRSVAYDRAANMVSPIGTIQSDVISDSLKENGVNFGTPSGEVSWDNDANAIILQTEEYINGVPGLVLVNGRGIACSIAIDENNQRIWESALTARGLNASLIRAGQLDTNLIHIMSGNNVAFSWNSQGLVAYHMFDSGLQDPNTFIKFNEDGLIFNKDGETQLGLTWDGMYIKFGSDMMALTQNSLSIYDLSYEPGIKRLMLGKNEVVLGEQTVAQYGLILYDNDGSPTIYTDSLGRLLAGKVSMSDTYSYSDEGVSGTTQKVIDSTVGVSGAVMSKEEYYALKGIAVPEIETEEQLDTRLGLSIRFWSGTATPYERQEWIDYVSAASDVNGFFAVLQNGTILATGAQISGHIEATSGSFKGTIEAEDGKITGKLLIGANNNHGINGNYENYNVNDPQDVPYLMWAGREVTPIIIDGEEVGSNKTYKFYIDIDGTLHATSAVFDGTLVVDEGIFRKAWYMNPSFEGETLIAHHGFNDASNDRVFWINDGAFAINYTGDVVANKLTLNSEAIVKQKLTIQSDNSEIPFGVIDTGAQDYIMQLGYYDTGSENGYSFRIGNDGSLEANNLCLQGSAHILGQLNVGDIMNDHIIIYGNSATIASSNYVKDSAGWFIGGNGEAEFNNLTLRGKIQSSVFEYNTVAAIGGDLYLAPTVMTNSSIQIESYIAIRDGINTDLQGYNIAEVLGASKELWADKDPILVTIKLNGQEYSFEESLDILDIDHYYLTSSLSQLSSILMGADLPISTIIISKSTAKSNIRMSAMDIGGPRININGMEQELTRLGYLGDLIDQDFSNITGVGLYSTNAYLKGRFIMPSAGMTNDNDTLLSGSPVRIWAGDRYENRASAPFIVTQDGSLYAEKGIFRGHIEASGDSTFAGTLSDVTGLVVNFDRNLTDATKNYFFIGYDGAIRDYSNLIVKIGTEGLDIVDGGVRVYSDAAFAWVYDSANDKWIQDAANYKYLYGDTTNPWPTFAVLDSLGTTTRNDQNAHTIMAGLSIWDALPYYNSGTAKITDMPYVTLYRGQMNFGKMSATPSGYQDIDSQLYMKNNSLFAIKFGTLIDTLNGIDETKDLQIVSVSGGKKIKIGNNDKIGINATNNENDGKIDVFVKSGAKVGEKVMIGSYTIKRTTNGLDIII